MGQPSGWMPGVIVRNIPPGSNDPGITPVGVVLHVRGGKGPTLFNYFNGPSGGIESHFYIRYDGTIEQYRDVNYEADAQSEGNSWVMNGKRVGLVSIEHEGVCGEGFTPQQISANQKVMIWLNHMFGAPLKKITWYHGTGVGYHCQFKEWNPNGHECPCKERIAQFDSIYVPWFNKLEEIPPTDLPALGLVPSGEEMFLVADGDARYITRGDVTKDGRRKLQRLTGGPANPADADVEWHDVVDIDLLTKMKNNLPTYYFSAKEMQSLGWSVQGLDPSYDTSLVTS